MTRFLHLKPMRRLILSATVLVVATSCVTGVDIAPVDGNGSTSTVAVATTNPESAPSVPEEGIESTTSTPTTSTAPDRLPGTVPPESVGERWGEVVGLTMFRGNPTRTFFGSGPVPRTAPTTLWQFPDEGEEMMAGQSPVGSENKVWTGTGWTGQPIVWERPDGITEVIFGAYDKQIHFLNADTGERTRPDFDMGDIIKGSLTLDPDGYPLLYAGSRDPRFRIIALDEDEPYEVWSLHATSVEGIWNDDWDSNPVVVNDVMYEGGENSWWFAVKLNRGYAADGAVTVDPQIVYQMPTWTEELTDIFRRQHSVESSTAVFEQRAYFSTSAGRIVGVDVSDVESGNAADFFDFWMGDDTDATISIDREGFLYVVSHADTAKKDRTAAQRVKEVGDLVKLDPDDPDNPIVWSVHLPAGRGQDAGAWATPALHVDAGLLFVATDVGDLLAIDTTTGETVWQDDIGRNAWSSPVIADGMLVVVKDCYGEAGLRAYDLADPRSPQPLWDVKVGAEGCIESTPAIWNGRIYVGSRNGYFYALGSG